MMSSRLQGLRDRITVEGIDAVLVSRAENRRYLSGFTGSSGFLFIAEQTAVLATDFRYTEQAAAQSPDFEIRRITGTIGDWFPALSGDSAVKRVGFEAEDISFDMYGKLRDTLQEKNAGAELVPVSGVVEALRTVKEPEEIRYIEKAVAIADTAFTAVEPHISAGMTEKQVAWELEKALRENGSEALPFEIIVASGPNAALPHAQPSEREIQSGDAIVIDMGASYRGYASDMTRTLCVGTPGDTFRKVYATVLDAQVAAMAIISEGTTGHDADTAAREVIRKAGYGEAFGHSLGHGVGLAAHELPHLSQKADGKLTVGMVFTVEPGIYLTGWGGVRIEDTVMIVNGKAQAMTQARKVNYD